MEILLPILAYVGIMGTVLWFAARKSANAPLEPNPPRERVARVYTLGDQVLTRVAQAHGLKHDVDVVTGRVGDLRVEIAVEPDGTQPVTFNGVVRFPRSLGLDLRLRHRGALNAYGGVPVVSDDFDHVFQVEALHADQARGLLSAEAGAQLMTGASRGYYLKLDDDGLSLSVDAARGVDRSATALTWLIETAQAIVLARAGLRRPELEQRVHDSFTALAQGLGGRVEGDELHLDLEEGELVSFVDHVTGKQFRTRLTLVFDKPLPVDLRLGLESEQSFFARFKHKDLQLGDDRFDRTFVVFGEPEDEVKGVIDAELRRTLVELSASVDSFTLTPTELELGVNSALSDRDALGNLVDAMRNVARALCPRRGQGAYR
ncbi:MAG: hypothetical protein HYZ29_25880 [Myxococcales bacterium]|nr:hypothetical protein [Myxococcales bacterium]